VAADRGDTLPILTGVRVEVEGDTMTLLATDRYRLAMRELHWNPTATDASHVVLIPARTLSDISRSLGASGSVDVALGHRGRRRRPRRVRGRAAAHHHATARR
jgi:DNA polymerase-3 subunit beta